MTLISDSIAGHDSRDSTTVSDEFIPTTLDDTPSVQGLKVGIPMVNFHKSCHGLRILSCEEAIQLTYGTLVVLFGVPAGV